MLTGRLLPQLRKQFRNFIRFRKIHRPQHQFSPVIEKIHLPCVFISTNRSTRKEIQPRIDSLSGRNNPMPTASRRKLLQPSLHG